MSRRGYLFTANIPWICACLCLVDDMLPRGSCSGVKNVLVVAHVSRWICACLRLDAGFEVTFCQEDVDLVFDCWGFNLLSHLSVISGLSSHIILTASHTNLALFPECQTPLAARLAWTQTGATASDILLHFKANINVALTYSLSMFL